MTHSTFYLRLHSVREETRCRRYTGYSFRLARVHLYYHLIQECIYHGPCYTSRGALAVTRNSSMGPLWGIDITSHRTMSERSATELYLASNSGVTESLFGGVRRGAMGGPDLRLGGGWARGRYCNDFFPITFIVHNQKSNGGGQLGAHDMNGVAMYPPPPPRPPPL